MFSRPTNIEWELIWNWIYIRKMFGAEMERKDNNNTENYAWVIIAFYSQPCNSIFCEKENVCDRWEPINCATRKVKKARQMERKRGDTTGCVKFRKLVTNPGIPKYICRDPGSGTVYAYFNPDWNTSNKRRVIQSHRPSASPFTQTNCPSKIRCQELLSWL
jgi:hypothetical protein